MNRLVMIFLLATLSQIAFANRITVAAPFVELRTGPGRGYPVTQVIGEGESLDLLKIRTDWVKVTGTGRRQYTGWVRRSELLDAVPAIKGSEHTLDDSRAQRLSWRVGGGGFADASLLTTSLGLHATPNLTLQLTAGQAFSETANSTLLLGSIQHTLFPHWRLSPYVELGVGQLNTEPEVTLSESATSRNQVYSVGGGIHYHVARNFFATASYNQYQVLTDRNNNEEIQSWQLGVTVTF